MKAKKVALFVSFLFAATLTFADAVPFIIRNYYSDWNLIALAASPKEQDRIWKMIRQKRDVDIRGLSQKDAMIVGAMVNIYKNYPIEMEVCPVQNTVMILTGEVSQSGTTYSVRYELRQVGRLNRTDDVMDLDRLFGQLQSIPKTGTSEGVWEYRDNEYKLTNYLTPILIQ